MRILFVSHLLPYPPSSGALARNLNLLKGLAKNHEVHLLTFTQQALLKNQQEVDRSVTQLKTFLETVDVFPIPTDGKRIPWLLLLLGNLLFSKLPYSVWRFASISFSKRLKEKLKEDDFDVVHFDTIALAEYRYLVERIPSVLNHHNIESTLLLRRAKEDKNPFARFYLNHQGKKLHAYEGKVAREFSANTVVSQLDGETLTALSPSARVSVVENGTDTDFFQPQSQAVDGSLVFVGGMSWFPNSDAMKYFCSDIYPLIKAEQSDVTLSIIGSSPSKELEDFGKNDPSIRVMGFVDDIREYVAKASVYIVPIRIGGGTRLKILDAMAMGKAIVSTTIGAEGILAEEGKAILRADTASIFAERVLQLLRNPGERKRIEANARQVAENIYAWEKITPKLEQCYRSIID